jgi:putative transposase
VQDKLPQKLRGTVAKKMRAAYHADSALAAQAQLEALARELDKTTQVPPPACAKDCKRP